MSHGLSEEDWEYADYWHDQKCDRMAKAEQRNPNTLVALKCDAKLAGKCHDKCGHCLKCGAPPDHVNLVCQVCLECIRDHEYPIDLQHAIFGNPHANNI